ncbi:MAG: TatD family hydrolase [Firmicutes bacterium]|nr:TatD family hydrolase [Bacillota bacterium]MBQ6684625.1 TatD family hydrolase [Bacillota bacterium]MBQ6949632.1 TatD family hydrolase [Bacillota bacterium]
MEKLLFDSHAHINEERFEGEKRSELCEQIRQSKLNYVMDIGFDLESSLQAVKDAAENDFCYAVVGVHPHDAKSMDEAVLAMIRGLAKKPKVQAIGEIGLDFHYDNSPRDEQRYWFRKQIQLAVELQMPIVIHSREADQEVMDILKEEGAFSKARTDAFPPQPDGTPDARVLLHCFSGSKELGRQYVALGATLSIAGPVTYKNNRKTVEVVEAIDLSKLLIETDSPYLTPEPIRKEHRTNLPLYVEHTARKVAEIKGISFEEVALATTANAKRFFGIED